MANRNNVPYNVLVTDDNSAILTKNSDVEDLTPGKIGFFDYETNKSFDNTSSKIPKRFFVAVGTPEGDFRISLGQGIQKNGVRNFRKQEYTAGTPMKVTLSGFKPKFDSEYGIRVEFRNSEIYRIQGYNQFSKAYVVKTSAQADCDSASECIDPINLAILLTDEVNGDRNDLLTAKMVADQDVTAVDVDGIDSDITTGDEITKAQAEALMAHNAANDAGLTLSIELEPNTVNGGTFASGINLKFHKYLQTVLLVSSINNSDITITETEPVFSQGRGEVIMQKEYHTAHYNGASPYVISMTTHTPLGDFEYTAKKNSKYTQFSLEYDNTIEGGFLDYKNPLKVEIAIPEGHTSTVSSIETLLEKL